MNQYEWRRTSEGDIDFDYSEPELNRRRAYLEEIDKYAKATDQDITDSLEGGRQVFCWGAGSGKTTAIRQFIVKHYAEGIVYATFTKEEATKMAYDVAAFIGHSRVLLLHTDSVKVVGDTTISMSDFVNQNPDVIKEYPVVITTHRRLLIDPPHLYTALLNRSKSHKSPLRKFIFIDEKPNVYDKIHVSNAHRDLVSLCTGGETDPDRAIEFFENVLRSENPKLARAAHNLMYYLTNTNPEKAIAKDRILHVLYTIFELESTGSELVTHHEDEEYYSYYYHLGLLEVPNLVIFDGTGDCLFAGSESWKLVHNPKFNYKFAGSIDQLDLYLPRNISEVTSDTLFQWIEKLVETMNNILLMNEKVLIVTWKSLHGQLSLLEVNDTLPMTLTTTVDGDQDFHDYIARLLVERGIAREKFSVTYYQSGKTRSTSEFSDCDSILFLGAFNLPNYVIFEYNKVNRSKITNIDYLLAEVVQATYRTRIRKGQPVSVYMSQDFNPGFMTKLHEYLTVNTSKYFQYKLTTSVDMDPRNVFASILIDNAEKLMREGVFQIDIDELCKHSRRANILRSLDRFHADGISYEMVESICTFKLDAPIDFIDEIPDE